MTKKLLIGSGAMERRGSKIVLDALEATIKPKMLNDEVDPSRGPELKRQHVMKHA